MADGDQFPQSPTDPVVRLERTAENLAALTPDIVNLLGAAATAEATNPEIPERVKAAARMILESLTVITDAAVQPGLETATEQATPDINPSLVVEEIKPNPLAIPEELNTDSINAFVDAFVRANAGKEITVGRIAFTLGGGTRLDRENYTLVIRALNGNPHTKYYGGGIYEIDNNVEEETVRIETAEPETALSDVVATQEEATTGEVVSDEGEEPAQTIEQDDEDQEDFEDDGDIEIIEVMARFMGRNPIFTSKQLREHLLANELFTPEEVAGNKINDIIYEFSPYIEEYYYERGELVEWLDSGTSREGVLAALQGRPLPKAKTYVLGFKPRPETSIEQFEENVAIPIPKKETKPALDEKPVQTQGQHERGVTEEQMKSVVDTVASIGNEARFDSIVEMMTDSGENPNPPNRHEIEEWIKAARAQGYLFKRSIGGHRGVSLFPPDKRPVAEIINPSDPAYIADVLEKYELVAHAVLDNVGPRGSTEGKTYTKLWNDNADRLKGVMTYDEFKRLVRNLEKDGIAGSVISGKDGMKKIHAIDAATSSAWKKQPGEIVSKIRAAERQRLRERITKA